MNYSVINSYQLGREAFPLTIYRVDYPEARATYSHQRGFQSAGNFTPQRVNGLRNSVAYHLDWSCRKKSPYISAFGIKQHAENWARNYSERNGYGTCEIVEICIEEADNVIVFRVADLVRSLNIFTPLQPSQYRSEYLCFRHIPSEAIVRREPVYEGMGSSSVHDGKMHY